MDEVIAAMIAVPTILLGVLMLVTVVEGTDRRHQLYTVAHRGALAASAGVTVDATPPEVRAAVAAGAAAVAAAASACADQPTVTVEYYDQLYSSWLAEDRYQGNTDWTGTPPRLSQVRVSVQCWPRPGPLPAMTSQVTHTAVRDLAATAPLVVEAPEIDPTVGHLQEERP